MKIIAVDNLNRDNVSEKLVAESIRNEDFAKLMCKTLNDKYCKTDFDPWHYVVRDDNYVLYKWEP